MPAQRVPIVPTHADHGTFPAPAILVRGAGTPGALGNGVTSDSEPAGWEVPAAGQAATVAWLSGVPAKSRAVGAAVPGGTSASSQKTRPGTFRSATSGCTPSFCSDWA